jgi:hypothetical protein
MKASTALKILGSWGALMSYAYWRSKKQDMTGDDRSSILLRTKTWKDHPLVAWMIENSSCWLIAFVRLGIFGSRLSMKTTTSKMINMIGTTLITVRRVVRE